MDVSLSWLISQWVLLMLGIGLIIYLYGIRTYGYFSSRRIAFVKPIPFIGNLAPLLFQRMSFPDYLMSSYNKLEGHQIGGIYHFSKPLVMLRDPDIIKAVTVKDFEYFTDHMNIIPEDADPMWGKGLFNLQGQRWKDMRSTLSPAFTSSKMKTMFVLIEECGNQLVQFLEKCCEHNYTPEKPCKIEKEGDMLAVELKDLFTRYTNDVIATSAYGVSVNSLTKPSNEFYLMGKDASNFGAVRSLMFLFYVLAPKLMQMLNITIIPSRVTNFFRSLMKDTMTTRESQGIVRPDLVQLLMQAKKGALQDETSPDNSKRILQDDDLTAQAFSFFFAGFDTTSTLICFVFHQLAVNPECLAKLQDEIDTTMRESGGKISYETIHGMKYLDMVTSETLRLYPPAGATDRCCIKPYTIPSDPPLQLKPGDAVWIPIYAIHHDPNNFPNPEKFDPERFNDENKHSIKPSTYLPFGSGPRICIGSRFALMESKIALVKVLHHFNLKVISRTPIPIKLNKKGFNMTVDGGFWMGLEKRKLS